MTTLWLNNVEIPELSKNEIPNIYIDKTKKGSLTLNGKIFEFCGFKRISKLETSEYCFYIINNGIPTLTVEVRNTEVKKIEEALLNTK